MERLKTLILFLLLTLCMVPHSICAAKEMGTLELIGSVNNTDTYILNFEYSDTYENVNTITMDSKLVNASDDGKIQIRKDLPPGTYYVRQFNFEGCSSTAYKTSLNEFKIKQGQKTTINFSVDYEEGEELVSGKDSVNGGTSGLDQYHTEEATEDEQILEESLAHPNSTEETLAQEKTSLVVKAKNFLIKAATHLVVHNWFYLIALAVAISYYLWYSKKNLRD